MKNTIKKIGILALLAPLPVLADDIRTDDWKEGAIQSRIEMNELLHDTTIVTNVVDGKASLTGEVDDKMQKELAEQIAKGVDGVSEVTNNINIVNERQNRRTSSLMKKMSDATTTAKVKSKLLWSSSVPGLGINVDTVDGNVILSGAVDTRAQSELAQRITVNTTGVRGVDNQLAVKEQNRGKLGNVDLDKVKDNAAGMADSAGDTISDSWVTAKASTSLRFSSNADIENLSVKTTNGIVTLTGIAKNKTQKELATEVVKDIRGVKSVVNNIIVK